jgi:hypothetical protein
MCLQSLSSGGFLDLWVTRLIRTSSRVASIYLIHQHPNLTSRTVFGEDQVVSSPWDQTDCEGPTIESRHVGSSQSSSYHWGITPRLSTRRTDLGVCLITVDSPSAWHVSTFTTPSLAVCVGAQKFFQTNRAQDISLSTLFPPTVSTLFAQIIQIVVTEVGDLVILRIHLLGREVL